MRKLVCLGSAFLFVFVACRHANVSGRLEPRMFKQKVSEPAPARDTFDGGPEAAAEALLAARAYPEEDVPADAHDIARATFKAIAAHGPSAGTWDLIGAGRARYPGLLTYTGKDYVTSGRITALAIGPSCTPNWCRLWVGAAGGGVWRTDRALDGTPQWKFVSGSFDTNAIGTLLVDPTDASGNTIYAGTGEPNASADSAAGVGIYKSTDGGDTWTLLQGSKAAANGRAVASIAIDPTNSQTMYVGTTSAVRGVSSVSGGAGSGNPAFPAAGIWKSTDGGATFAMLWGGPASIRGVTDVALDPQDPQTIYAAVFRYGIWRSSVRLDGTADFKQVFVSSNATSSSNRTTFAITTKDGKTRIYAGTGTTGGSTGYSRLARTDNADVPATTLVSGGVNAGWKNLTSNDRSNPYWATYDFCTGQCWYDMFVVSPKGYPDMVFVGGSYQYGEYWRTSNSRSVLLSTTAGDPDPANNDRTFTDVSWSANPRWQPDGIHPDQHALVVSPNDPNIFFEGSDGGLMRSDGNWEDASYQCAARGLTLSRLTACLRLLSRVPRSLISMNDNLTTLQFQSLSINPQNPLHSLLGGTQDNGTFDYNGSSAFWSQTMSGDGGQSGFDAVNDKIRFHTFYGSSVDVNFDAANPKGWLWISDPLGYEYASFYVPIIADPVVGGTMFIGQQRVWRTKDSGGDRAYLETWCSELYYPGPGPSPCGDWEPIGADLTSTLFGTDRRAAGHYIAAVQRARSDRSTLWAATLGGRLFISRNADAEPASSVAFTRFDTTAVPGRFVSGIAIDPANANHGWVSYTGYNVTTPLTPGHVFEVNIDPNTNVATFTNLNVEGASGDLPINGIARDDVTGDLYVATDFGVLHRSASSGTWGAAGSGLPFVEVAGLAIDSGSRVLYAATHGRSAWRLRLP